MAFLRDPQVINLQL